MSNVAPIDPFAALASFGIRERPPSELDPALDATERCLARHGVGRTTMSDIAKEMGVSRPTLYKHVGSVEEAIDLVAGSPALRDPRRGDGGARRGATGQTFIDLAVRRRHVRPPHPVAERILVHEPDMIGTFITSGQVVRYIEQVIDLLAPILGTMMDAGAIRAGDPRRPPS